MTLLNLNNIFTRPPSVRRSSSSASRLTPNLSTCNSIILKPLHPLHRSVCSSGFNNNYTPEYNLYPNPTLNPRLGKAEMRHISLGSTHGLCSPPTTSYVYTDCSASFVSISLSWAELAHSIGQRPPSPALSWEYSILVFRCLCSPSTRNLNTSDRPYSVVHVENEIHYTSLRTGHRESEDTRSKMFLLSANAGTMTMTSLHLCTPPPASS